MKQVNRIIAAIQIHTELDLVNLTSIVSSNTKKNPEYCKNKLVFESKNSSCAWFRCQMLKFMFEKQI